MPIESLSDIVRQNVSAFGYAIAWPRRTDTFRIVSDVAGSALGTLGLTASRQYFIPFVVPRPVTLTGLRISVTTAAAGTASIGIYDNVFISGNDTPGGLRASVTGLDISTTGDKSGTLSLTLLAGVLYWASMIASAAATVRAVSLSSQQASLGRAAGVTGVASHLFAPGSGSTLPNPASTSLTIASSPNPAIYLLE